MPILRSLASLVWEENGVTDRLYKISKLLPCFALEGVSFLNIEKCTKQLLICKQFSKVFSFGFREVNGSKSKFFDLGQGIILLLGLGQLPMDQEDITQKFQIFTFFYLWVLKI